MSKLANKDCDTLFIDDYIFNGRISEELNSQGYCHKTVFPACGVDGFIHLENCIKLDLIKDIKKPFKSFLYYQIN